MMKLGFVIRAIEFYFAAVFVSILGYALVCSPDDFAYDITLVRLGVVMAVATCSIWLIEKRSYQAPLFIITTMSVVIVLSVIDIFFGGEYEHIIAVLSLPPVIVGGILYFGGSVFIIFYMAFSPHVKAIFVESINNGKGETVFKDESIYPKAFTWPWFRNLVMYYCIFSIVGHWAEIAFCWLIVLGVFQGDYDFSHAQLWDQWLYPYPAEGIAVVLIVLLLFPLKEWLLKKLNGNVFGALILSFIANAFVCTAIDFLTGITVNADYHLWDYSDLPFNFMGQIVLQNSLVYSLAATAIVWIVYPLMAKGLHRLRKSSVDALFFLILGFYAFLEVLYFIHLTPAGVTFG